MTDIFLFKNLNQQEINTVINCTNSFTKIFSKNEFIALNGDEANYLTILLSGNLAISKTDFGGNKIIIAAIKEREVFGEAFIYSEDKTYKVDVLATTKSEILFIPYKKLTNICTKACDCHNIIMQNLLYLLARKNMNLNEKLECLSQKTTQGKIAFFLLRQYEKTGKNKIIIPFNRENFSEYLGVNRSALSRELSKLQKKGIITFSKNNFSILDTKELEKIIYLEE